MTGVKEAPPGNISSPLQGEETEQPREETSRVDLEYLEAYGQIRKEPRFVPATGDIFAVIMDDIRFEIQERAHIGVRTGKTGARSRLHWTEDAGLRLLQQLPRTHLPPVEQATAYMENLANYHEYMATRHRLSK
ncbi:hypothetical protein M758_UG227500 [Ceratodon purpureus]|nr:hypothetical protein M758_UG227500 [Ceratodon purpureus]